MIALDKITPRQACCFHGTTLDLQQFAVVAGVFLESGVAERSEVFAKNSR